MEGQRTKVFGGVDVFQTSKLFGGAEEVPPSGRALLRSKSERSLHQAHGGCGCREKVLNRRSWDPRMLASEDEGEPESKTFSKRIEEERAAQPNLLPHEDMKMSEESPGTMTDGTAEDEPSKILTTINSGQVETPKSHNPKRDFKELRFKEEQDNFEDAEDKIDNVKSIKIASWSLSGPEADSCWSSRGVLNIKGLPNNSESKIEGQASMTTSSTTSIPSLLLWTDVSMSAAAFTPPLLALVALTTTSFIAILAWVALLLLTLILGGKVYVYVMVNLLGKLPAENSSDPLAMLYTIDLTIPADRVAGISHTATDVVNSAIGEVRRLFLAESLLDTAKFGASLYCLTYIGSWFNLVTLVIVAWCALFSLPRLYLNNQESVDDLVSSVMGKVDELKGKVNAVVPTALKKEE